MNATRETIIRVAALVISIVNFVLEQTGHGVLPFESQEAAAIFADAFMLIMTLCCAWKNNSFTMAAVKADKYMKALKAEEVVEDDEDGDLDE